MKELTDENYYENMDYVSNSMLGMLKQSPMHLYMYMNGLYKKEGPALTFGSAYHCAILEPDLFSLQYAVKPKGLKSNMKTYPDFVKEAKGKTIISTPDYDKIMYMKEALLSSTEIRDLIEGCEKEVLLTKEIDGLAVKGKLDGVKKGQYSLDLKTTQDSSPAGFKRAAEYSYDYDRQAALYTELEPVDSFLFIVQEKENPQMIGVYEAGKNFLAEGTRKYITGLKDYKHYFVDGNYEHSGVMTGLL